LCFTTLVHPTSLPLCSGFVRTAGTHISTRRCRLWVSRYAARLNRSPTFRTRRSAGHYPPILLRSQLSARHVGSGCIESSRQWGGGVPLSWMHRVPAHRWTHCRSRTPRHWMSYWRIYRPGHTKPTCSTLLTHCRASISNYSGVILI
jgi:hypothetical protein